MKINPAFDRIIVKMDEVEEQKSASGLVLNANTQQGKPKLATVMAVGPGKYNETTDTFKLSSELKVGDRVLMPSYGGVEVEYDGEDCILIGEVEVLGTVEE